MELECLANPRLVRLFVFALLLRRKPFRLQPPPLPFDFGHFAAQADLPILSVP